MSHNEAYFNHVTGDRATARKIYEAELASAQESGNIDRVAYWLKLLAADTASDDAAGEDE